ncbi:MAG: phage major capsid protein, partial [Lysobacter sp.]|nr:phage major capsid protein [Lysobacter sp.]
HSSSFQLAKSTVGEYLFGAPGSMTVPSLWGVPVVVTASMTAGSFLVLDAPRAGFVATREDATVRISEHTNDDFIRNLIRILVEERLALCIARSGAIITGTLSNAG